MRRYEVLGREGGAQPIILIVCRKPWSVYLTLRTPWLLDRMFRVRIQVGNCAKRGVFVQWLTHRRERCADCRAVVPADADGHRCEGLVAA